MDSIIKIAISFGVGFFVARYILLGKYKGEYLKVEAETVDKIQNKMHDVLKSLFPNSTDEEVSNVVLQATNIEGIESDGDVQVETPQQTAPTTNAFIGGSGNILNEYNKHL